MPSISLTSFLKILTKGTPQKVTEYGKHLTPGGYDFYWQLKEAAHAFTVGGESYVNCVKPIEGITREVERKHNLAAFKSLSLWLKKHKVTEFFDTPAGVFVSPGGLVTVKLEPELGAVVNGQKRVIQLWNNQATLNSTVAGVGIFLLEKELCTGDFTDCKAGVLNLRKRELFVYDALPPTVASMANGEIAWAEAFFKTHAMAA